MFNRAWHINPLCWPAIIAGILLLPACENDLKKVKELSAKQLKMNIDTVHNVDVIYSDSAKVKARMTAPVLLQHTGKNPYNEMIKGIKIVFYNDDLTVKGDLTADYGVQYEAKKIIEFRRNVVAKNDKGETFKSDELIREENLKQMHSSKVVQITMANGDIMNGTGFKSDLTLNHWTIDKSTGIFNVPDSSLNTKP